MAVKRAVPRWMDGTYIIDNTVVGIVEGTLDRPLWFAYGCDVGWADVRLGSYSSELKAKRAVVAWVKERL